MIRRMMICKKDYAKGWDCEDRSNHLVAIEVDGERVSEEIIIRDAGEDHQAYMRRCLRTLDQMEAQYA
jgi:hypothetical protein